MSDSLAYRLSAAVRSRDGFVESTTGAESLNRDRALLRGQLLFEPSDSSSLRIIGDYSDADEQCCDAVILVETPAVALGSFAAAGLPRDGGAPVTGDRAFEERISNAEQFDNPFEQTGFSLEWNKTFGGSTTLTYIGSYRDFKATSVQHSDFVGLDIFSVRPEAAGGFESFDDIESTSHELRLDGDTGRFRWLVGGYYSDESILEHQGLGLGTAFGQNMDAVLWNFAFAPVLPFAPLLANVPMATGGTFGQVLAAGNQAAAFAGNVPFAGAFGNNVFEQDTESYSIFTDNTFDITDNFAVNIGARYVDESKDGSFRQLRSTNNACLATLANAGALIAGARGTGLEAVAATIGNFSAGFACFPFTAPAVGVSILPVPFSETFEDDEVVYTGKLIYKFSDRASLYGSYTHGFKSGGFNLDATAAVGGASPSFRSELIDSLEFGLKTEFANRRVRLNATVFDYDMEDFQVLEFTGVQFVTFNVPTAESSGAELELNALLGNKVTWNFGYTYADSKYPEDCDGGVTTPTVSTLCGAQLTNAPKNVATTSLDFDDIIGERLLYFLSAYGRYEDDRRTSTQPGLARDIQESNTKIGARIGVGGYTGKWTFELWGDNLTDEQTRNVTFNTPLRVNSRGAFLEAPRTFGATLRLRY